MIYRLFMVAIPLLLALNGCEKKKKSTPAVPASSGQGSAQQEDNNLPAGGDEAATTPSPDNGADTVSQFLRFSDGKHTERDRVFLDWSLNVPLDAQPLEAPASYQVAIGSTPGTADVVPWTSVNNVSSLLIENLNLTPGMIYYGSVAPVDAGGIPGRAVVGDGFEVLAPVVAYGTGTDALHNCMIREDNSVSCIGDNAQGQLGPQVNKRQESAFPRSAWEVERFDFGPDFKPVKVSHSDLSLCALSEAGQVACTRFGQPLAEDSIPIPGEGPARTGAVLVDLPTTSPVIDIAAGTLRGCSLHEDGSISCWGSFSCVNSFGMGNDCRQNGISTFNVFGGAMKATKISGSRENLCAIFEDGSTTCWGSNRNDQLGKTRVNGELVFAILLAPEGAGVATDSTPINLLEGRRVAEIAISDTHACALTEGSTVHCWGRGSDGQLGYELTGPFSPEDTPAPAITFADNKIPRHIATVRGASCAVMTDDTLQCWGDADTGILGDPTAAAAIPNHQPRAVTISATVGIMELSSGLDHMCAKMMDQSVRCWGTNRSGALGLETEERVVPASPSLKPLRLSIGQDQTVQQIAAGLNNTCAIHNDHELRCWGSASTGSILIQGEDRVPVGAGKGISHSPVPLDPNIIPRAVGVGQDATCVIDLAGHLHCWGRVTRNQISSMQFGPAKADQVTVTGSRVCVRLDNGAVRCTTLGTLSQQNGSLLADLPLSAGASGVTHISGAGGDLCAIENTGAIRCWIGESSVTLPTNNTRIDRLYVSVVDMCALSSSTGRLYCWPFRDTQGLTDITDHEVFLGAGRSAVDVAMSMGVTGLGQGRLIDSGHTCALLDNGALQCWGDRINPLSQSATRTPNVARPTAAAPNPAFTGFSGTAIAGLASLGTGTMCVLMAETRASQCWGGRFTNEFGVVAGHYGGLDSNDLPAVVEKLLTDPFIVDLSDLYSFELD